MKLLGILGSLSVLKVRLVFVERWFHKVLFFGLSTRLSAGSKQQAFLHARLTHSGVHGIGNPFA